MANCVNSDQTAPSGAVWLGFALFAQFYLVNTISSFEVHKFIYKSALVTYQILTCVNHMLVLLSNICLVYQ